MCLLNCVTGTVQVTEGRMLVSPDGDEHEYRALVV
jgi:hypothetical protein